MHRNLYLQPFCTWTHANSTLNPCQLNPQKLSGYTFRSANVHFFSPQRQLYPWLGMILQVLNRQQERNLLRIPAQTTPSYASNPQSSPPLYPSTASTEQPPMPSTVAMTTDREIVPFGITVGSSTEEDTGTSPVAAPTTKSQTGDASIPQPFVQTSSSSQTAVRTRAESTSGQHTTGISSPSTTILDVPQPANASDAFTPITSQGSVVGAHITALERTPSVKPTISKPTSSLVLFNFHVQLCICCICVCFILTEGKTMRLT